MTLPGDSIPPMARPHEAIPTLRVSDAPAAAAQAALQASAKTMPWGDREPSVIGPDGRDIERTWT